MAFVYVYRLTSDTGLAPCVDNGLLSLAVCKGGQVRNGKPVKTGLRYQIGRKKDADYTSEDVYIIGTFKDKLLYFARVTNVVPMMEYFNGMSKGRTDDIYTVVNGELLRNKKYRKARIHAESNSLVHDLAGEYVILSDDFIYLGRDAVYSKIVAEKNAKFRETKTYSKKEAERLIKECRKYADGKKHQPTIEIVKKGRCK